MPKFTHFQYLRDGVRCRLLPDGSEFSPVIRRVESTMVITWPALNDPSEPKIIVTHSQTELIAAVLNIRRVALRDPGQAPDAANPQASEIFKRVYCIPKGAVARLNLVTIAGVEVRVGIEAF